MAAERAARAGDGRSADVEKGLNSLMRWTRFAGALALAAALAQPVSAQVAGQPAEGAPVRAPATEPQFRLVEGVLATVNDELITSYDLRQRMLLIIATSQLEPTEENLPAIQQQAMRMLIDQRLQNQEMARYELEIPDEDVESEIAVNAQQMGMTAEQYYEALERAGVRRETLREQLRTDIGWGALVSGRYRDRARVGDDQVDATLARITAAAAGPRWLVGEIYIDAAQVGGMDVAMQGANQLVDQILNNNAPFQAVARQFSQAPSAASGGDGGWIAQGEAPAAVERVLQQMNPGQLSRPIAVDGGVYIILLRDESVGGVSTLVNLRQAAVRLDANAPAAEVAAATERLQALREGLTCDNIVERGNAAGGGMIGSDMGEANVADLTPQLQALGQSAAIGSISQPIRTELGLHLFAVCGRRQAGADIPSRDEIRQQMMQQQLTMLARRYIRDLRNAAAIETRGA